ncbi:DUF3857 and transglutaminase domain-containing protein [Maribacter sp.]|nr:DUF3857 and transglutaminase domain-containing protein [Maribacter sp.]
MRLTLLLSSLLFVCFSFAQDPNYQAVILDKLLTDNANAVVRLDYMDIHLASHKSMKYSVHQVVTVLNKLGRKQARTYVSYDKETKVQRLEAFVYDKLGKEIEHFKKKDFKDVSAADGFSLYVDDRALQLNYTPVQYPYTMELKYEIETTDTAFFPPWYFLPGYMTSVEKSYYAISYASESSAPEIKKHNLGNLEVSEIDTPGKIVFEAKRIPALKSESLSPSFRNIAPRLAVRLKKFNLKGQEATVNNWKEFGIWMDRALLKDRAKLDDATIEKAKELVKDVSDDLEKAKIIYKYVQDNTRYISVQIGIGGWKPISAIDVNRVKYGDCKGLSNYTHALLKAVGVASYYTVIQAGNQKVDFDPDFAAMQGNHAILAIPYKDQYYWVDCTSQTHPFGFIGDFTDDRMALVVTPEGGEIVKTVAYLNEQNYQKTIADYSLSAEGNISAEVAIITKGIQYDNRFFLERKAKDDVLKYYKNYWGAINNLKVENVGFENDRDNVVFKEKVTIAADNYASKSGDRILFVVNALNKNTFVPDRYRNRKQDFEIQRGFLDEDEFSVTLPMGYTLEALPESKKEETEFGTYERNLEYNSETNSIAYKRSLLIKQGYYSKEKYKSYRDFRKKVASADKAQVVLLKTKP